MRPSQQVSGSAQLLRLRHFLIALFSVVVAFIALPGRQALADEKEKPADIFGGGPVDQWAFGAEAYLWGASVGGKTVTGDKLDVAFSDIVKDLDFGLMGSFVATKDKWTAFADLIYLDVTDDFSSTANIVGQPELLRVDAELKGFVTTLGGAYNFYSTDCTILNVLLGARYESLDLDLALDLGPVTANFSDTGHTLDGVVGMRGKSDFGERWYFTYYADIGTGESDLTWQGLVAVNYRFQKLDAVIGYRYLDWEFDGSNLLDRLDLGGPFAGVKFRF